MWVCVFCYKERFFPRTWSLSSLVAKLRARYSESGFSSQVRSVQEHGDIHDALGCLSFLPAEAVLIIIVSDFELQNLGAPIPQTWALWRAISELKTRRFLFAAHCPLG